MRIPTSTVAAAIALTLSASLLGQNNWVELRPGSGRHQVLDAVADQHRQRQESQARVDVSHRRHVRVLREHAARRSTACMYFSAQNGVYALDARDRPADLEIRDDRHRAARTVRTGRAAAASARASSRRPRTAWRRSIRRPARSSRASARKASSPGLRMTSPPVDLQEHPDHAGRQLDRESVGHRHRRTALDAEPQGAARRSDIRRRGSTTAGRRPAAPGLWGYLLGRRRARTAVRAGREGRQRLLRRTASRQQPLQRLHARGRREHRARSSGTSSSCITTSGTIDPAAPPTLVDVRRNGRTIPGVALITKMGMLFVFNRETGEPMYGMEERPVPQTTAQGRMDVADAAVPAQAGAARAQFAQEGGAREGHAGARGVLQGPVGEVQPVGHGAVHARGGKSRTSSCFPGAVGGGNWQGVMFNKPLGLIITNVMNAGQWGHLEERAPGTASRWPRRWTARRRRRSGAAAGAACMPDVEPTCRKASSAGTARRACRT